MSDLNILLVAGHPADMFDHCGGTLCHHVQRGDNVTCVTLTHGLRVHDVVIAEELRRQEKTPDPARLEQLMQERSKVKHDEAVEALGILGITDVRFLNYDDKFITISPELIEALARVIREIRPNIVIAHHPLENAGIQNHHGITGQLTLHAIGFAGGVDPDDQNTGWSVAQVFFMAPNMSSFIDTSLASQPSVFCDTYVDITDVIELKVRAWDTMRSQQYQGNYARKSAETWNGKDGCYMGVSYAEGFVRYYPEIGDHLFVSQERLERANEPEAATRARTDQLIAPFVKLPE